MTTIRKFPKSRALPLVWLLAGLFCTHIVSGQENPHEIEFASLPTLSPTQQTEAPAQNNQNTLAELSKAFQEAYQVPVKSRQQAQPKRWLAPTTPLGPPANQLTAPELTAPVIGPSVFQQPSFTQPTHRLPTNVSPRNNESAKAPKTGTSSPLSRYPLGEPQIQNGTAQWENPLSSPPTQTNRVVQFLDTNRDENSFLLPNHSPPTAQNSGRTKPQTEGFNGGLQNIEPIQSSVPALQTAGMSISSFDNGQAAEFQNNFQARNTPENMIWWRNQVTSPIFSPNGNTPVDTNSLVYNALKKSPRIRAISQDPLIREMQVVEADSEFDPTSFVTSQFQDRVDPVGDSLSITADGSPFIQDHIWTGNAGIRKKTRTGGTYEFGQQIGFRNSNSNFFNPQDQGTATLSLNVTQPLLRGRGKYYNQSQILIAQAAEQVSWNTFTGELQDELRKTVVAYWQLYYARSVFLQKQKSVERGSSILAMLEGRRDLDSLPSQIARARSAVQSRKTDLANAMRDVRDAETEIRRLTAERNWKTDQFIEMVPMETPVNEMMALELEQIATTALQHRPEIQETMKRAKVVAIQRDVSLNELMPELSLLLGTYISALRGESEVFEAIGDQFGGIKPGYSFGLEFEMPWRNRAAHSRLAQRKLQFAKISAEIDEVIQNVIAESQVSLRQITSAKQTLDAALQAIDAARYDLEQNTRRWESFALIEGDIADGQTPTTILDQLLDSQERLASSELVFSQAELDLKSAEIDLQRTMGTLLIQQQVSYHRGNENGRAQVIIDKLESTPTRQPVPFQQANPDQSPAPSVQGFFYKNLKD